MAEMPAEASVVHILITISGPQMSLLYIFLTENNKKNQFLTAESECKAAQIVWCVEGSR